MPLDWRFVPVKDKHPADLHGNKDPKDWFDRFQFDADFFLELNGNRPEALGLLTGPVSGVLVVDLDDHGWPESFQKESGRTVDDLPSTIAWSSGKPGRSGRALAVPQEWWPYLRNRRAFNSEDGRTLWELRWDRHQAVICGRHPQTGAYHWLEGCSPQELGDPAEAPEWLLELLLQEQFDDKAQPEPTEADAIEALQIIGFLPPLEYQDHDSWLKVGMALHHLGCDVTHWVEWSRAMPTFDEKECHTRWKSFGKYKGRKIGMGSLLKWGAKHGYARSRSTRPGPTYQHDRHIAVAEGEAVAPLIAREFQRLRAQGPPIVILQDPCGSGKTKHAHDINRALATLPDIKHVVYVNSSYRNLSFPALNRYVKPPARHRDVVEVEVKFDIVHRTRRRDQKDDDLPVVESATCHYAWNLGDFKRQGAKTGHIKGFCNACPRKATCSFISERDRFLAFWQKGRTQFVRTNIDLLPFVISTLPDELKAKTVIVFDEANLISKAQSIKYEIVYERFDTWLQYLRNDGRFRNDELARTLVEQLRDLEINTPKNKRYGLDPADLKEYMKDWIEAFRAIHGDQIPEHWADLATEPVESPDDVHPEQESQLTSPLLFPAVAGALLGFYGAIRSDDHPQGKVEPRIALTVPSDALQRLIQNVAGAVVLDATTDPAHTLSCLSADPDVPAATLATRADTGIDRIQFIQIPCLGALTANRRPTQTQRRNALAAAIEDHIKHKYIWEGHPLPHGRTPSVAVIDQGSKARSGDLKWHVDNRGSNAARSCAALICFGLPWISIGDAKATFTAHYPDATQQDFDAWYLKQVGEELIQGIHRLRPIDLDADDQLQVFLVTNADLSGMGIDITQAKAEDFSWFAADPHRQTIAKASNDLDELFGQGAFQVTQAAFCTASGTPRSTLKAALQACGMSWADLLLLAPWRAADAEDAARPRPRGRPRKLQIHPAVAWLAAQPAGFWARK
ncbi:MULTISPECIES: PriCT-2 domain-containing protein [unclassified Synechococcus]|nr:MULTISPECIES: PriCT-2 domain-containing protein [unclassified Synechococcus]